MKWRGGDLPGDTICSFCGSNLGTHRDKDDACPEEGNINFIAGQYFEPDIMEQLKKLESKLALQDAALDVLAREFSDITPCNNCPCIKRCQDTDEDCVSLLKAYAFEEARRRMR